MTLTEKGIHLKLFAGFSVTSELRMHINSSPEWKEHQIIEKGVGLTLIPFEGKNYLGIYIEPAIFSLDQINELEKILMSSLKQFFPKYQPKALNLYFFTQAFIQ